MCHPRLKFMHYWRENLLSGPAFDWSWEVYTARGSWSSMRLNSKVIRRYYQVLEIALLTNCRLDLIRLQ